MSKEEIAWVSFLRKKVKNKKDVLVGIGDDCAYVKLGKEHLVLKSDLSIEDVHFNRKKTSLSMIGERAVARVLSDFAACAAKPKFIGVSVGIPRYIKRRQLESILDGIIKSSKKYGFSLIGGDTSRAQKLFIDVWGIGTAEKFISRSKAAEDDHIFVTGKIGRRDFHSSFKPRIDDALRLAKGFKITSMIDISDGFAIDLYRVLALSSKGAVIFKDKLPLTKGIDDIYRGEDYELIFTVDKDEPRINKLMKSFYCVGRIKKKNFGYKIEDRGVLRKIKVKGYSHL